MLYILFVLEMLLSQSSAELFSVDENFQISKQIIPNELGHIWNYNTYRQTGWNKIYIYTNPHATPLQQHRAAGFLQGYATYADIYSAYKNFVGLDFQGQPYAPTNVQDFLDQQLQYMEYMVKTNPQDKFWTYVGYYLQQLRYMHAGYLTRIKQVGKPQLYLDFKQIYYLPSIGDLEDLIPSRPPQLSIQRKNCNGYIRLDGDKLYTTHGTHNRYSFLLRTYKHWSFPRKDTPLQSTSFTSRPGDLISKDDFYLLSTGLRVIETSLQNLDQNNLNQLSTTTVPSWLRTLVANHLSTSASQWIDYFLKFRSGTHNNQWVLIDPKRIQQKTGLAVIIEQAFTLYKIVDVSQTLRTEGYIGTYNTPITAEVYNKLGYTPQQKFTYQTQPRAIILKLYHPKMQNIEQMKYWLVMNQQKEANQTLALSPRYDLEPSKLKAFGMTDCKVSSEDTIKQNYFWAISGPPVSNGRFPAFDWRTYTGPKVPREGIVDLSDFDWQKIEIDIEKQMNMERMNKNQALE